MSNVISLADRVLGDCPECRRPVVFAENFVRVGGAFFHVRCALTADVNEPRTRRGDFPRPAPPPVRGA